MLASSAFPSVYPPVEIDGHTLVDGGVVADVPLDICAALGAANALVLSIPPLAAGPIPRRAIDILIRASSIGVEAHGRERMAQGIDTVVLSRMMSVSVTWMTSSNDQSPERGNVTGPV